jgi:DNA-binding GntR family transcriptional regulator
MSETADRAYREIRDRVRNGLLPPGSRLVERTLCKELGMSRTPVREALRLLAAEGLVESRPNRGMAVARLTEQELDEVFEVGLVLESFIASLATRKAGGRPLEPLRGLLRDMRRVLAARAPDRRRYIELDQQFHSTIAGLAENQRLANMLQTAMDVRVLHQAFSHYSMEHLQRSLQQHETILLAIEGGDDDWAASAMRTHILSGRAISHADEAGPELAGARQAGG